MTQHQYHRRRKGHDRGLHTPSGGKARAPATRRWRLATSLGVAVALVAAGVVWLSMRPTAMPAQIDNALELRNLPGNRWVKYHEEKVDGWRRQGHAGMAYDAKRGSLLIFGSDTHGEDWDNAVHEFKPREKRWDTHYPPAGPETYRVDDAGRPVAGTGAVLPWAMHTYDAIEYHPRLDALVVTTTTEHNPRGSSVAGVRQQPTWIYELATRKWRPFPNQGQPAPTFFGGSSAYDDRRQALIAYRGAIWELDLVEGRWLRAAGGHHQLHHTMVFASPRGAAYVFGNYRRTTTIWSYRPGPVVGAPGTWERHEPGGDPCPPYGIVPVAYDPREDVFVLVVDDKDPASSGGARAESASTYLYDPAANTYTKLPHTGLPPLGMNYMMVWDSHNQVALLVTGTQGGVITVWAMRPSKRGIG
jgi:hypothetical protein